MNRPVTENATHDLIPLRAYLRTEGLVSLAVVTCLYAHFSFSWWLYAVLFFAPDLFMLGYVVNPRVGALLYNIIHTYTTPVTLLAISCVVHSPAACAIGLIWCAHIGFDRLLGYGLKHDAGFGSTHLDKL